MDLTSLRLPIRWLSRMLRGWFVVSSAVGWASLSGVAGQGGSSRPLLVNDLRHLAGSLVKRTLPPHVCGGTCLNCRSVIEGANHD